MMELTYSGGSPFVRKARIAAAMKGLTSEIRLLDPDKDATSTAALRGSNPLAKIPVLRLGDGTVVYDSLVICEYLDGLRPAPKLFPSAGAERLKAQILGALADGIMDAAILAVYEKRFRPEPKWHQEWVDRQLAKIDAGLGHLEANVPDWSGHPDYGHISLACALGFLDLRLEGRWRAKHPKLVAWLDRFAKAVPAWAETAPPS